MGQQNVHVCKIKKNKPFAPPSEKRFLLCFETKKKSVSENIFIQISFGKI